MATLLETTMTRAECSAAAAAANELVRLVEFELALDGKSDTGHTHSSSGITDYEARFTAELEERIPDYDLLVRQSDVSALTGLYAPLVHFHVAANVTDFEPAVFSGLEGRLENTYSFHWDTSDDTLRGDVQLKTGGYLYEDAGGLAVRTGESGLATQADLDALETSSHAAATVLDGVTVDFTLTGQQITAEVILDPAGGLVATDSGLAADFGTAAGTVAEGDHTHAGLHDPVTVTDSATVNFTLTDQDVTASVRLDASPGAFGVPLGQSSAGLFIPTSGSGVAPYSHVHANATTVAAGFMSAADKLKLNGIADGSGSAESVIQVGRLDAAPESEYIGGRFRFASDMVAVRANVESLAPSEDTVVVLLVDGVGIGIELTIPSGVPNTEVFDDATYSGLDDIPADVWCRWQVNSGPAAIENCASRIHITLNLVPA